MGGNSALGFRSVDAVRVHTILHQSNEVSAYNKLKKMLKYSDRNKSHVLQVKYLQHCYCMSVSLLADVLAIIDRLSSILLNSDLTLIVLCVRQVSMWMDLYIKY